ncbi:MAG: hypothetical protein KA163_09255 [Bacteroidia bacterium]|nr:hypothetical protein [Bacteroidia bacterium]
MKDIFSLKYFSSIYLGTRRILASIAILMGAILVIILMYTEKRDFNTVLGAGIITIGVYWLFVLLYCWIWNGFLHKDRARDYLLRKLIDDWSELDKKVKENDEYIEGLNEQVLELREDLCELSGRVTDGFVAVNNKLKGLEYLRMK